MCVRLCACAGCGVGVSTAASLPWFGPVVAGALAPPSGRHDVAASAVILSEGGQLHVHDVRAFADGGGAFEHRAGPRTTPFAR